MNETPHAPLPRMREQHLVVDDLPDEVLVYDLDRHQAHCLNLTAALVWRECDGRSPAARIAERVSAKLDQHCDEATVWAALEQLDQLELLAEPLVRGPSLPVVSRRAMMRRLGLAAAIAAPVITSLVAPTAAEAATCLASGATCSPTIRCCSPLGCNPGNHCH